MAMIIDLSPAEYRAAFLVYSVELTGVIILILISIAVLRVVLRCSVIHMNLKVRYIMFAFFHAFGKRLPRMYRNRISRTKLLRRALKEVGIL